MVSNDVLMCVYHVLECCSAGTADCSWAPGFSSPFPVGVALDPSSGALFVTNYFQSTVCRVPGGGGAIHARARADERGAGQRGIEEKEKEGTQDSGD